VIIAVLAALTGWLVTDDWLIGGSILVLGLIWTAIRAREGPPVLALAVTLQWVQVTIGLFYVELTGRPIEATLTTDCRPMVAIGLACVAAVVGGLWCGQKGVERTTPSERERSDHAFGFTTVLVAYGLSIAVAGVAQEAAWTYPALTQPIIALSFIRLGLLYLVLRRLALAAQWHFIALLLAFEVGLSLVGFYAGFREPLIIAVLVVLEIFDRRSVRHWVAVATLVAVMCGLGAFWINVRQGYRERVMTDDAFAQSRAKRFDEISNLSSRWMSRDAGDMMSNADQLVDRVWAVYYPALAVARVPAVVPHTNGQLMWATLKHLFSPRLFFPDKPVLGSESELVRTYSGVWVAGEKEQTNIAFGYAAESYVDFGVPLMFVPVFLYGVFVGAMYAGILRTIYHRDIAVALVTVFGWLSLYLFERSWAKTIGLAGTLILYAGALSIIFDRLSLSGVRPVEDDVALIDLPEA
jgi:hypothetical protein